MKHEPGTLVRYREREWVVLPSSDKKLVELRPLGGAGETRIKISLELNQALAKRLSFENIEPSSFPLPDPSATGDEESIQLLLRSARLLIRDGAAPFRSFASLSIRPRPYQLIPLMMAMRMSPVRLLIADDVGVGKTIEAGLIARELMDRGEARRLAVICPPYLCDQWHDELLRKFGIESEVIRSGTVTRLERRLPPDASLFGYFPNIVCSVDLIKSERYRDAFLLHCPDLVLADEVHGMARPASRGRKGVQQRYELLRDVAAKEERGLILITATPHGGIEESFLSLLGLINAEFETYTLSGLEEKKREKLARHFVQRRRPDLKKWLDAETPFPERDDSELEQAYVFHAEYKKLFDDVFKFAHEIVKSAETLTGWKKRMRFYSALALMRSISSSPAAAHISIKNRLERKTAEFEALELEVAEDAQEARAEQRPRRSPREREQDDAAAQSPREREQDEAAAQEESVMDESQPLVLDPEGSENDSSPGAVMQQDPEWKDSEIRKLRQFALAAEGLKGDKDAKLVKLIALVKDIIKEGGRPIVWCRYIGTAKYVAEELRKSLKKVHVIDVTGEIPEDERKLKIAEFSAFPERTLVATDCLSEGINLQEAFDTVIHYDLPWNPNRMEQREGRVDRYGQKAKEVKIYMLYGSANPVDGAIFQVLIRKAREIHRQLGIQVPIPMDSESIMETVMHSIFLRGKTDDGQQFLFDEADPAHKKISELEDFVKRAREKEQESRSRFAQKKFITTEIEGELQRELEETDRALGSPAEVESFFLEAGKKIGLDIKKKKSGIYELRAQTLPDEIRTRLGDLPEWMKLSFSSPEPEGCEYVGRNHVLIESLAEYLTDRAFHDEDGRLASRIGVIRAADVTRRTVLLLLRLRFLQSDKLAEETALFAYRRLKGEIEVLGEQETAALLSPTPSGNVLKDQQRELAEQALQEFGELKQSLKNFINERVRHLNETHTGVRRALRLGSGKWTSSGPPDLLGLLVLLPDPGRQS